MEIQAQADLLDVHLHKKENEDFNFLLTVVDVFTKKAWVFPIKTKSGPNVARALGELFAEVQFKKMQTDKGREVYNAVVARVMSEYDVVFRTQEWIQWRTA